MVSFFHTSFRHLTPAERRRITSPILWLILVLGLGLFVAGLSPWVPAEERPIYLGGSLLFTLYGWGLLRILFPYAEQFTWMRWVIVVGHATLVPVLSLPFPPIGLLFDVLMSSVTVILVSILFGKKPAYLFLTINALPRIFVYHDSFLLSQHNFLLIAIPFFSLVLTETVSGVGALLNRKISYLEAINHVARKVGSTIEPREVVNLLSAAIRDTLEADTYYVGIHRDGGLCLEVLYDDGIFYPPEELRPDNSLTALVMQQRRSLLIANVPEKLPSLGLTPTTIGKEKMSLSWMGTPMEAGGHTLGIVAVASYRLNAFHPDDLELLESIAQQAALALDNAYHHAEVEEQSRRDSLTGVYNHGYFLLALEEQARQMQAENRPLALIMLDIDFFKSYNDTYGHLVGDQVLIHFSDIIRRHLKATDLVGRWGGEEFAISLPGANGAQAYRVAQRISETLRALQLQDRDGNIIPAPTASQGIALFPYEADEIYTLVDLADQRLYLAKTRGRDQIAPPLRHWEHIVTE